MMEALGEAPPAFVESLVTEDAIVKALREMLPLMNADTVTLKVVMQKLAVRFGMEFGVFKAQWKSRIKALLPDMLELCPGGDDSDNESEHAEADAPEGDDDAEEEEEVDLRPSRKRTARAIKKRNAVVDASEEEDDDANDSDASEGEAAKPEEDEDDVAPAKKRRTAPDKSHTNKRKSKESAALAKKTKTVKQVDPPGLASLKELGRAAGVLNPRVYKLLKGADSTEEAEEILRDRLQDAGVAFHGSYPTSRDISATKRKHAKEKELEGIDSSLIITGGRSRRGGGERISYKHERLSGEEDNAEVEEDDKEDADEVDEEEEDEEESAASDSDSSEASF
ncbi:hypothetical protein PHYPSEUDO_007419 [Phytophthora pseudosyringae]|uniref:DEK C-terminal domain-containing protein n=1 Tax=Phytophthora pseudosyringae TaxID=221518 RepID=A0A8T1WHH7_9STRA|nr:hypothetical protein PHYPSEUDO_007419 [Phytophthora pseudosyringae]